MSTENVYAKIEEQINKQYPFVVYRKANSSELNAFFQQNDNLYTIDDYLSSGFVFTPFDTTKKTILIPSQNSEHITTTIPERTKINLEKKPVDAVYKSATEETHIGLVKKGIDTINKNHLKKVVLSRKEEISGFASLDALKIFQKLADTYAKAFVYYWYHPKVGTWLGATPETLLQIKDNEFSTMALAGTQPYKVDNPVVWENKELEEQEMVTKFILNELSPIAQNIVSSKTYTHRAGTLLHLRTDIKATLTDKKSGIQDVINILHPTPAVCGLPKDEAKSFILKNEGYNRKFYTGFLGELNIKREGSLVSSLFVNLRCMEIEENKAILYVGGGITKDSIPEKEWRETVNKTETMKKVLF